MLNCRSKNKVKISNLSGDILCKRIRHCGWQKLKSQAVNLLEIIKFNCFFMYAYSYAKSHPHTSVQSVLIADLILRAIFGKR